MENRSHDEHITVAVFNERRKGVDGRFMEVERRMGVTEYRIEKIDSRLNWLIGLALLGLGMVALNLFLLVSKT